MAEKKQADLLEGPLLKKLILYSIPVLLTGILQNLYHAADLVVVGSFNGHTALAAVGSTSSLYNMLVTMFMGLSMGAGVCTAQYIGAKDDDGVRKVVRTSFLAATMFGTAVGVVGFILARPLLAWMGTPANILDDAVLYLRILFCGMPFNMIYNYMAAVLRSAGDTKRPLLFLTISGLINVGLNILLVVVFHFGVAGVALGTIASNICATGMILISLHKRTDCLRFRFRDLRIDGSEFSRIMWIGIPTGLQSTMFAISNVLIQSSLNSFGDVVVAGNSAAVNLESFVYVSVHSVSIAATTFVGQCVGAEKYSRIRRVVFYCAGLSIALGTLVGGAIYLLHTPLLSLYVKDNLEAQRAAMERLEIVVFTYFLCGILDVFSGALRSLGKAITGMVITLIGVCGMRVFWVLVVFPAIATQQCIYVSYPVSWILTGAVLWMVLHRTTSRVMKEGFSIRRAEQRSK